MISVQLVWLEILICYDFLRHHKRFECQTLHDVITLWALIVHTTFNNLDHILRSQLCQFWLQMLYLFRLSLRFAALLITLTKSWVYTMNIPLFLLLLHIFKGNNGHVFWSDRKFNAGSLRTLFREGLSYGLCMIMLHRLSWTLSLTKSGHQTPCHPSNNLLKITFWLFLLLFVCFYTYLVSCNGPCALKEKWHRKEHIISII